jgi:membrane-associated phospholipid phosphatase
MPIYLVFSRLFDPFLVLVVLLIFVLRKSSLSDYQQIWIFIILFTTSILLPVGLLFLAIKNKIVQDWDLRKREERPKLLVTLLIINILNTFLVKYLGDQLIFNLYIFILAYSVGFLIITLFWKISGHLGVSAIVIFLIIHWYGSNYYPLLVIIPLVAWARIKGKFHTFAQVIGGVVYSFLILQIAIIAKFI